jgi:phage terminase small subunit
MARGRKGGDEALVSALAAGASPTAAAQQAGVSPRTAQRRLADPAFRQQVDAARNELLERTVGRLSAVGVLAADKLYALLEAASPSVQLGAARGALEFLLRGHEVAGLARQVAQLKAEVEGLSRGRAGSDGSDEQVEGAGGVPGGGVAERGGGPAA